MATFEPQYRSEIQQMMYVGGETQDPSTETLTIIETIIRDQVILMLTTANDLAARRGSRVFSNNDLIFQVRHDAAMVARLQTYLRWKAIRKAVRDDDDKGQSDLAITEGITSDALISHSSAEVTCQNKKPLPPRTLLPWDIQFFFSEQPPSVDDNDELADRSNNDTLEKLCRADELTRNMTADEYAKWSEYRHASFTRRKVKRFREWSGLGIIADHNPSDDSLDILGFITCEMVQKLTGIAISIQQQEFRARLEIGGMSRPPIEVVGQGPFGTSVPSRPPIGVSHIRKAFHLMQMTAKTKRPRLDKVSDRKLLLLI